MSASTLSQEAITAQPGKLVGRSLLQCADPIVDRVLEMQSGRVQRSTELWGDFERRLRQMEEEARRQGFGEEEIRHAKYALVALIDETVRLEGFPGWNEWDTKPLQLKHLNTYTAGRGFYEKLSGLLLAPGNHPAVEVYYLCLLMGFTGDVSDEARGLKIREAAKYLEDAGRLTVGRPFSPRGMTDPLPPPRVPSPAWPLWAKIACVIWVLLLVLLLALFRFILVNKHLDPAVKDLLRSGLTRPTVNVM